MPADHYTRQRFALDLRAVGMSRAQFARVTGCALATVYHWGYPATPFPRWVPLLVDAWQSLRVAGFPIPSEPDTGGALSEPAP